jgi:putative phosphoribosyl transferase
MVILVDDGFATGTIMRAALRQHIPAHLVVAVPTAPAETRAALPTGVDHLVSVMIPRPFNTVS